MRGGSGRGAENELKRARKEVGIPESSQASVAPGKSAKIPLKQTFSGLLRQSVVPIIDFSPGYAATRCRKALVRLGGTVGAVADAALLSTAPVIIQVDVERVAFICVPRGREIRKPKKKTLQTMQPHIAREENSPQFCGRTASATIATRDNRGKYSFICPPFLI